MGEWRDIEGYNYRVNSDGQVLSLYCNRLIKAHANRGNGGDDTGYLQVWLNRQGKSQRYFVHRLVAAAFIGPRAPHQCVNHKNGNKLDNRAANLEYCTQRENMNHALASDLIPHGERHYLSKFSDETARQILGRYERGEASFGQLAKEYNVAKSTIRRMVKGVTWKMLRKAAASLTREDVSGNGATKAR